MMLRIAVVLALACSGSSLFAKGKTPGHPADMTYYADAYAEHYGVPREIVYAVISQESGWKATAVSNKGAQGLMQLMPATSLHYAVTHPFDISENIGAGTHYLADLYKIFHDWRLAVASYYCGPLYPMKRGLAYSNPDVFIYVTSIQRNYARELQSSTAVPTNDEVIP